MNWIKEKPYLIFFISFLLLVLFALFTNHNTLEINIHDTYFVITYAHIAILIAPILLLQGVGYWIIIFFKKKLNAKLNFIHIVCTFLGGFSFIILNQFYSDSYLDYSLNDKLNTAIGTIVIIIIINQILYCYNIIQSILKRNGNYS